MSALEVDVTEQDVLIREIRAVEINGAAVARVEDDGCWTWLRYIDPDGYGRYGRNKAAYRVVYTLIKGPIPDGHHVHHVCRNRACVNPDHLEALTIGEHARRTNEQRTCCVNGHAFTAENTYTDQGNGARLCRTCRRDASRRWKRKKLGWAIA